MPPASADTAGFRRKGSPSAHEWPHGAVPARVRVKGNRTNETIHIEDMKHARAVGGRRDEHLKLLRDAFRVGVLMRGNKLTLEGDPASVRRAAGVVRELLAQVDREGEILPGQVKRAIEAAVSAEESGSEVRIEVMARGRSVRPKTQNQAAYIRAMAENDIVSVSYTHLTLPTN